MFINPLWIPGAHQAARCLEPWHVGARASSSEPSCYRLPLQKCSGAKSILHFSHVSYPKTGPPKKRFYGNPRYHIHSAQQGCFYYCLSWSYDWRLSWTTIQNSLSYSSWEEKLSYGSSAIIPASSIATCQHRWIDKINLWLKDRPLKQLEFFISSHETKRTRLPQ